MPLLASLKYHHTIDGLKHHHAISAFKYFHATSDPLTIACLNYHHTTGGPKHHHATFGQKYYHAPSGLLISVSLNYHHSACGCHHGIIMPFSVIIWSIIMPFLMLSIIKIVSFHFSSAIFTASESKPNGSDNSDFTIIRTQQATNKRPYNIYVSWHFTSKTAPLISIIWNTNIRYENNHQVTFWPRILSCAFKWSKRFSFLLIFYNHYQNKIVKEIAYMCYNMAFYVHSNDASAKTYRHSISCLKYINATLTRSILILLLRK